MAHIAHDQILASLVGHPDYEAGSAHARTKICCEVLTKLGQPIPSWMVIRQYIGKGSATDISRGVKDFRAEHASLLQRIDGMPEGIPDVLAQPIQTLWRSALDAATSVFELQRRDLNAQQAEAERVVALALAERDALAGDLALATEKIVGLQAAIEQERERANGEHSARVQAERMANSHIHDLPEQRNGMTEVVKANTRELQTMAGRLEDERRRALMQIEEARQQVERARLDGLRAGEQKMAALEKELRKEMADQSLEHFYLQKRYSELSSRNAKLSELLNKDVKSSSAEEPARRKPLAARSRQIKGLRRRAST